MEKIKKIEKLPFERLDAVIREMSGGIVDNLGFCDEIVEHSTYTLIFKESLGKKKNSEMLARSFVALMTLYYKLGGDYLALYGTFVEGRYENFGYSKEEIIAKMYGVVTDKMFLEGFQIVLVLRLAELFKQIEYWGGLDIKDGLGMIEQELTEKE